MKIMKEPKDIKPKYTQEKKNTNKMQQKQQKKSFIYEPYVRWKSNTNLYYYFNGTNNKKQNKNKYKEPIAIYFYTNKHTHTRTQFENFAFIDILLLCLNFDFDFGFFLLNFQKRIFEFITNMAYRYIRASTNQLTYFMFIFTKKEEKIQ